MRTQYELEFEELVTSMILGSHPNNNSLEFFLDFHRNSQDYYDLLCDALLALSTGHTSLDLWVTPSGKPYLAETGNTKADRKLLNCEQVPVFIDDIREQIELALASLKALSSRQGNYKQIL